MFNLDLSKTGGVLAAGTVTAAGVETINITAADASTATGGSAAVIHTATLTANEATKVTVSGNNGLTLTATGSTKVTTFDASGVVANGTAGLDTAANLAVTYTSLNDTTTANVTITGGAGDDVLTGGAAKDAINGGAGNDIINGGLGLDAITVGNGRDIVQITNNDDNTAGDIIGSGTSAADTITGFGLVSTGITGADLSTNAKIQAYTAAGANLTVLNLDVTADDAGVGAGANQALAVEANATGAGQAAGVTYTVTNGILTLGGAGAAAVDTLGEWLVEAAAVAATAGDVLGFQFGSDTYVFAQNGTADVLVQLVGVAGSSLVEVSGATTASAGAILYADL
ncbi:calcium-binding protein [Diaphorobacter sp. JS3050]|uniref:beta strand repeat-containing protein n=1 Tax=Diaphorobacter sp. JS3050 TaxID=2735554 RepID=UPI001554C6DB|nr:calcium-binding protein [Diaphorobacter sp. JS3050]QJY32164.1 calcium-binding protein [Diaphorobacter sp. JS3050]